MTMDFHSVPQILECLACATHSGKLQMKSDMNIFFKKLALKFKGSKKITCFCNSGKTYFYQY